MSDHSISRDSLYDKVASLIITLLILIGITVAILFGIWLTATFLGVAKNEPVAVERIDFGTGINDNAEFDPDVIDPGVDVDSDEPTLQQSLQMVADAVSTNSSLFSDPADVDFDVLISGGTKGDGRTKGNGDGKAGRRHWEFLFPEGNTVNQYAKQLDYFEIELGVPQPGGKITYVSKLSTTIPQVRTAPSEFEDRYYLTWLKGDLEKAERDMLNKAGVDNEGKMVVKFISPKLEQHLAVMEITKAGDKKNNIRATYFTLRPQKGKANAFEFYVSEQIYR